MGQLVRWRRLVVGSAVVLGAVSLVTGGAGAQTTSSSTTTTSTTPTPTPTPIVIVAHISGPLPIGPFGTVHVEGSVTGWGCPDVLTDRWDFMIGIGQPTIAGAPGSGGVDGSVLALPPGGVPMGFGYVTLPCTPAEQAWATDVAPPEGHPFQSGPGRLQAFMQVIGHPAHSQRVNEAVDVVLVGGPTAAAPEAVAPDPVASSPTFAG